MKKKKKIVKSTNSHNIFKFGDRKKVKSLQKILMPVKIGASNVLIETDIDNEDILLILSILSKETMKKRLVLKSILKMILLLCWEKSKN